MPDLKTTVLGLLFIARREALVTVPYIDGKHHSWGFGHNDPSLKPGMTITPREAWRLLVEDVKEREATVLRSLEEPERLAPNQFDALVSLYYQGGSDDLHLAAERINILGVDGALEVFPTLSKNAKGKFQRGLLKRRLAELRVYMDGDYGRLMPIPRWDGNPREGEPTDYWLTWEDMAA